MPSTAAWVDTGFLVALFGRNDPHFTSAVEFLAKNAPRLELHSLWPVVAEACFFLDTPGKVALLDWLEREPIILHELTMAELPAIRATLRKYHDLRRTSPMPRLSPWQAFTASIGSLPWTCGFSRRTVYRLASRLSGCGSRSSFQCDNWP